MTRSNAKIMLIGLIIVIAVVLLTYLTIDTITGSAVQDSKTIKSKPVEYVKIGVFGPMAGPLGYMGEWMTQGANMAAQEINAKGGINGKKIKLVFEDTQCKPTTAVNVMMKFRNIDQVNSAVGPFCGSSTQVAGKFSKQNEFLIVSPSISYGRVSDMMFSTMHANKAESYVLAEYAYKELNLRNIAVLYFNNDYGINHKTAFMERFKRLGGTITAQEPFEFSTKDFKTPLIKFKSKGSDGIVIFFSAAGIILNQIAELGIDATVLSTFGIQNPSVLEVAGSNADNLIYTYPGSKDKTISNAFQAKYKAKHNKNAPLLAASTYDALHILARSLKSCSLEQKCAAKRISDTKNYQGALGDLSFDKSVWTFDIPLHMRQIQGGKFVVIDGVQNG